MAKNVYYSFVFDVRGSGHFPVDMLRYDTCVPYGQDDINKAFCDDGERTVRLIAYHSKDTRGEATSGRWKSFGWNVVTGNSFGGK